MIWDGDYKASYQERLAQQQQALELQQQRAMQNQYYSNIISGGGLSGLFGGTSGTGSTGITTTSNPTWEFHTTATGYAISTGHTHSLPLRYTYVYAYNGKHAHRGPKIDPDIGWSFDGLHWRAM